MVRFTITYKKRGMMHPEKSMTLFTVIYAGSDLHRVR
jgi:hypothetical protein